MAQQPASPFPDAFRVPPAPRDPSPLARKLVYGYQGSQRAMLFIGIAFTIMGGLGSIPATYGIPGEAAILLDGKPATGTVTEVAVDRSYKINKSYATRIDVEFKANGATYKADCHTINGAEIAQAKAPGATMPVEYASFHPGFARIGDHSYSFFGWIALAFWIMPITGVLFWFRAWRSNRREIRAFRNGIPIVAAVTARTHDRTTKVNGRHPRVIRWRFVIAGQPYQGEISHLDAAVLDAALPNPQVIALYDPQNPATNTVWLE